MGSKASILLQDQEIEDIQRETGCKFREQNKQSSCFKLHSFLLSQSDKYQELVKKAHHNFLQITTWTTLLV